MWREEEGEVRVVEGGGEIGQGRGGRWRERAG